MPSMCWRSPASYTVSALATAVAERSLWFWKSSKAISHPLSHASMRIADGGQNPAEGCRGRQARGVGAPLRDPPVRHRGYSAARGARPGGRDMVAPTSAVRGRVMESLNAPDRVSEWNEGDVVRR